MADQPKHAEHPPIELPSDEVLVELAMLDELGYERNYRRNALRRHIPGAGGPHLAAVESAIDARKRDPIQALAFAQAIAEATTAHRLRLRDRYDSSEWLIANRPPSTDGSTPPGPVLIYVGHAFPTFQVAVYENLRTDGQFAHSTRRLPDGRTLGGLRWWTTPPPAEHIQFALDLAQLAAEQIKPPTYRVLSEE